MIMDIISIIVLLAFFGLTLGLVVLCEHLQNQQTGGDR
jgi:hypothetical protein